ncbi:MAG TPA: glycosyltransferase family 39 protein [Phycisphaerae bacterium]|nr:glycosyltransferase family 39 protein [Phycisphaerae bacterium]
MSADVSPATPLLAANSPAKSAAPSSPSLLEQRKRAWPSTRILWLSLLLLTGIGAFLRFWRLGYQSYWTDEAYTIDRIHGSFYEMLGNLSDQGFPPGWYAILRSWHLLPMQFLESGPKDGAFHHLMHYLFAKCGVQTPGDTFQPAFLRVLPAFLGTLTVPAMYFLARQFTDRRGALLVMVLTAVNPFLIYYSRDIKMYQGLIFFAVINMALFFHWQNTRRHLLWFPLFLISGIFLLSMHAMAFAIPALQLIFLLTSRKPRGWEIPLWMTATAAAAWIPIYWYLERTGFQRWGGRISSETDQGMDWIQQYTDMSWKTIAGLPTSHLLGYLWPEYPPDERLHNWFLLGGDDFVQHIATRSWPWMARWQEYCAWTLFAIMVLGLVPWRRFIGKKLPRLTPEDSVTRGRWWWVFLWIALPTTALALTWIPLDSVWSDRVWFFRSDPPKPLWEPRYLGIVAPPFLLWLAASLRRLPTVILRSSAIALVVAACTFSALSNHLFYRNAPFTRADAILEQYITKNERLATAVAVPEVKYPFPAENAGLIVARDLAAGSLEDLSSRPVNQAGRSTYSDTTYWPSGLDNEFEVRQWIERAAANRRIRVIVLTDRYGDVTAKNDILSDESLEKIMAPRWKLVHKETYEWHYEWRFYIFHTWRTRVWVLNS